MGLTFEQLKPSLFKWATHYHNNRFDFWELISEAWLSKGVQQITNPRFVPQVVRWAMINYMKVQGEN